MHMKKPYFFPSIDFFSLSSAPSKDVFLSKNIPRTGDLVFDYDSYCLMIYDQNSWVPIEPIFTKQDLISNLEKTKSVLRRSQKNLKLGTRKIKILS